jgi:hypothetical protein
MSNVPLCTIVAISQLPLADIESLEMSLNIDALQLQKPAKRLFGADDILLIMAVVSGTAGAAQLLDYGIKTTKAIISWRHKQLERGKGVDCILEHPERPPLDLRKATDEEIEEWFTR